MLFNVSFDTYRLVAASDIRTYSATKTITGGAGYREPVSEDLRATLGLDSSTFAYMLVTEETDLQVSDKVTISSEDSYIDGLSSQDIGARKLTRAVLIKKKS